MTSDARPPRFVAVWGLASAILAAGLSYALQVAVGPLMPPAGYSETQSLLGLYMMLAMPAGHVLLVVTRRVVDERAQGNDAAVLALLDGLLARTLGAGLVALVALVPAGRWLAGALGISDPAALPLFVLSVVTSLLYLIAVAVLLGQLRWRAATVLPVALGVARLVLSLVLVRLGYGVAGVFAAIALSTAACFVVAYARAVRALPRGGRYRPLQASDLAFSVSINTAFWFLVHVDGVYVNSRLGALASGGYGAVAALARPVVYFPAAVNNLLFPFLASVTQAPARRRIIARMLGATIALDAIALAALAAAPALLLELTFGPAYAPLAGVLLAVAATLAPLAVLNILLYDGLVRRDRLLAAAFVSGAAVTAAGLVVATPSLRGMLAAIAAGTAIPLVAGMLRAWPTVR